MAAASSGAGSGNYTLLSKETSGKSALPDHSGDTSLPPYHVVKNLHKRDESKRVTLGLVPGTDDHVLTYQAGRAESYLQDAMVFCYYAVQDIKIICLALWLMRLAILVVSLANGGIWLSVMMLVGLVLVEPVIVLLAWYRTHVFLVRIALWIAIISAVVKFTYLVLWIVLDWNEVESGWWWVVAALLISHIFLTAFPLWVPTLIRALVNLVDACMVFTVVWSDVGNISREGFRISKQPLKIPVPLATSSPPPAPTAAVVVVPEPASGAHPRHINVLSVSSPTVTFNPQVIAPDGSIRRMLTPTSSADPKKDL